MIVYLYILFIFLIPAIIRMVKGPTFFDRLVSFSACSLLIILIMCLMSVMYQKVYYLDIALVYSVLSFAGMIAYTSLFKQEKEK